MTLKTSRNASWLRTPLPTDAYLRESIYTLYEFFVLFSPCRKQSNRPRYLEDSWGDYLWISPKYLKYRLNYALFKTTNCRLEKLRSKYLVATRLKELTLDESDSRTRAPSQWAVYVEAPYPRNGNTYMSLFYHLRNALAHTRFSVFNENGQLVLAFEDGRESHGEFEVSARGVFSIESLLNVVHILKDGPNQRLTFEQLILNSIDDGVDKKRLPKKNA